MKRNTPLLAVLALLFTAACTEQTLDGGSTGDTKAASASEIADTPVAGNIASRPFEPKTIEISFSESTGKWILSLDNYEGDCGSIKDRPPSDDAMTVSVVGLDAAPGSIPIAPGATRYATLQVGVYMAAENKQPDTRSAQSGTVVLDNWAEASGAEITGKLKLVADEESVVEGAFTAKVCPSR